MAETEAPHYAEAFSALPDGCFRFVSDAAGRPLHCPEPPAWTGTFRDGRDRRWHVQACNGHRGGLEQARLLDSHG
jgi:hypothetical protein